MHQLRSECKHPAQSLWVLSAPESRNRKWLSRFGTLYVCFFFGAGISKLFCSALFNWGKNRSHLRNFFSLFSIPKRKSLYLIRPIKTILFYFLNNFSVFCQPLRTKLSVREKLRKVVDTTKSVCIAALLFNGKNVPVWFHELDRLSEKRIQKELNKRNSCKEIKVLACRRRRFFFKICKPTTVLAWIFHGIEINGPYPTISYYTWSTYVKVLWAKFWVHN